MTKTNTKTNTTPATKTTRKPATKTTRKPATKTIPTQTLPPTLQGLDRLLARMVHSVYDESLENYGTKELGADAAEFYQRVCFTGPRSEHDEAIPLKGSIQTRDDLHVYLATSLTGDCWMQGDYSVADLCAILSARMPWHTAEDRSDLNNLLATARPKGVMHDAKLVRKLTTVRVALGL